MNNPSQPNQVINVNQNPSNGLGIAGFVVSLVGWFTCGLLCPLGILLSFIAMFKQPRGFAIAGLIIGLIGSVFLVFAGFAMVVGLAGVGAAASSALQTAQFVTVEAQIMAIHSETGSLPSVSEVGTKVESITWRDTTLRYVIVSDSEFELTAPGSDQVFDTADDMVYVRDVNQGQGGFTSFATDGDGS